ncbi:MAG: HAD family hydrolase [Gemmatimonadota bacterium]
MPVARLPLRVAMWSGPRNISTAMMRAWENRPDTWVVDEPLYGHYLTQVDVAHPGRDEVIRRHETDWRKAVAALVGPVPGGRAIFYQKHMTHHLLPHLEREWLDDLTNCFLIRHPAEMLASLDAKMGQPEIRDTGLPQQVEIFRWVRERNPEIPPVLDGADVLRDPGRMLTLLCERLGVPFSEAMLHWPAGPRATDGVWAKHWYDAVERSTGFEPYRPRPRTVSPGLQPILDACLPLYEELWESRLGQ